MRVAASSGFTLIELVMVLVIIALVVGITAPSLGQFITARKTADAASQILALAHHARNAAIAEGRTYRLVLDEQSGAYWLEVQDGANFTAPGTALGTHYTLPSGTSARWNDAAWAADLPPMGVSPGSLASSGSSSLGSLGSATGSSKPTGFGASSSGGSNSSSKSNSKPAPQGVQPPGQAANAAGKDVKFYSDGRSDGSSLILTGSHNERVEMGAASESEPWRIVKDGQP
jgi:prepilin-type N-terminal cleavage/methylation domain-containing protein